MNTQRNATKKRRGIYLLPNLFTTAGLFAGFYAVVSAMRGHYGRAAIWMLIAMIMDGFDGRVARLTNTQSAFGTEFDSLADMVSFGVAPALVLYSWSLSAMGKFGWLAAFVYVAAAALRLARFNTQINMVDKRYFQGLNSPAAAGTSGSMVWIADDYGLIGHDISVVIIVITLMLAVLMVSNVRYHSFKGFDFKGRVPFVTILVVVLLFVLISLNPPVVLFIGFFTYTVSGPIYTLWSKRRRLNLRRLGRKKRNDMNMRES